MAAVKCCDTVGLFEMLVVVIVFVSLFVCFSLSRNISIFNRICLSRFWILFYLVSERFKSENSFF